MYMTPPPRLPAAEADTAAGPLSLHDLPNELLVSVLSCLDASSSLEPRFRDDASTIMDDYLAARGSSSSSKRTPLKAASLVCHRWRLAALPLLFRHVLWTFRRLEQPPGGVHGDDAVERFELLAFLRRNGLGNAVKGITLHVPCPEHLIDDHTELVGRYGLVPDSTTAPATHVDDNDDDDDDDDVDSVVLSESASLVLAEVNGHATWANTWFWALLFRVVTDPLRVSLLAAPVVLATMISRKVFTRYQPFTMTRYHLLSVSRQRGSGSPPPAAADDGPQLTPSGHYPFAPACDNLPCELFAHTPPWTALVANEGSFISLYKSENYGETPPSPLLSLLASRDPDTCRIFLRAALRRLEYIAIVPMSTHVEDVLTTPELVPPRLQELYVKLMPPGASEAETFDGLDRHDLIAERDNSYGLLFESIFIPGPQPEWESLRVFETGDAEDALAWDEAIENVQASRAIWEVDGLGRFVRNMAREEAPRRRRGGMSGGTGS